MKKTKHQAIGCIIFYLWTKNVSWRDSCKPPPHSITKKNGCGNTSYFRFHNDGEQDNLMTTIIHVEPSDGVITAIIHNDDGLVKSCRLSIFRSGRFEHGTMRNFKRYVRYCILFLPLLHAFDPLYILNFTIPRTAPSSPKSIGSNSIVCVLAG